MEHTPADQLARLRALADDLECLTEEDFTLLAGVTPGTAEAWRKRRLGPAYIRIGNRVLYPRSAVADHLRSLAQHRPNMDKALL
jgi:hypothetical protein